VADRAQLLVAAGLLVGRRRQNLRVEIGWVNSPTSGNERLMLLALADACPRETTTRVVRLGQVWLTTKPSEPDGLS
jgi:hypothetical protein